MGKKRNKTKKTQKTTSASIEVDEVVLSTPDSSSIDETTSAEAVEVAVSESSSVDETELDQTPDSSYQTASTSEANTNSVESNKPQSVFDANQDLPQDELVSAQNLLSTQLATASLETQSSKTSLTNKPRFYKRWSFWLLLTIFIAVVTGGIFAWNRLTSTSVMIGGTVYQQQSADQIAAEVLTTLKNQSLVFRQSSTEVEVKMADAGITIDAEDLTRRINQARSFDWRRLFRIPIVEPKMLVEYSILQDTLDQKFKQDLVKPTNASTQYDKTTNQFVTTPAKPGYRVDAKTVLPDASRLKLNQKTTIEVRYQNVNPAITTAAADEATAYLNQRLKLRLNLNHNGKLLYFADPWDIADWVDIKPNELTGKIELKFNLEKIQTFITKKVAPQIRRGVINQKVLVDEQGKTIQVLQKGVRGFGTVNPAGAAEKIYQAVLNNQNLNFDLQIEEVDFKEEKIPVNGDKWIDVNLSKQTTTLYMGSQALRTFVISSGVSPWQTPTGTFYVWYKNPRQVMTGGSREAGDYYYLPNVTWNTYFTHSGVGFHTAYWHNNFGRPMSHGCINMREADAKVVYDFAPIGTRVVVHY